MMVVTGYTSTILYSRRVVVVNFVANRSCKMEDTLDWCSSSIMHAAKCKSTSFDVYLHFHYYPLMLIINLLVLINLNYYYFVFLLLLI